jgi:hypothetical protein
MIFFLLFLVCGSNALNALVPVNVTKPTNLMEKVMADPKKFVAEVSNVDPAALAEIISLLEGLLTTSTNQEQDLQDKADEETAKAVQTAEEVLVTQAAVEAAQQAHTAAVNAHDTQEIAKDIAVAEHADQSVGLDAEQKVLRDVIDMLNGLHNTGSACTEFADYVRGDGVGTGNSQIFLGYVTSIQECLDKFHDYPNANGISVGTAVARENASRGKCVVEIGMTAHNSNNALRTCAFDIPNLPSISDCDDC